MSVVVALVAELDERARLDDLAGGVAVDHDRVLQHLLELADARLVVALLVLGRVVVGVLADVAVLAGPLDPQRDLPAPRVVVRSSSSAAAARTPAARGGARVMTRQGTSGVAELLDI